MEKPFDKKPFESTIGSDPQMHWVPKEEWEWVRSKDYKRFEPMISEYDPLDR